MRPALRRSLLVLAAAHLLLVTLGAAAVKLREVGPIGRTLHQYGILSGAGTTYAFFAPYSRSQFDLHFDVIDAEGRRTTTFLDTGGSREVEVRLFSIAGEFPDAEPELRRRLAASLAAKAFASHPRAREVVVRVEDFRLVSMEEFRGGRRPRALPFYEAKFKRGQKQPEAGHGSAHSG